MLVRTTEDWVSMMSAAATTCTLSFKSPGSMVTFTTVFRLTSTTSPVVSAVLKPSNIARSRYVPGGTLLNTYGAQVVGVLRERKVGIDVQQRQLRRRAQWRSTDPAPCLAPCRSSTERTRGLAASERRGPGKGIVSACAWHYLSRVLRSRERSAGVRGEPYTTLRGATSCHKYLEGRCVYYRPNSKDGIGIPFNTVGGDSRTYSGKRCSRGAFICATD